MDSGKQSPLIRDPLKQTDKHLAFTHLSQEQFFGTAFWIGFTVTYIAGEPYLRSRPVAHPAYPESVHA
jgi:hypothetical protein